MSDSGNTIGLYFPLSKDDLNALRHRLNYLFGTLGYADEDSTPPYRGGLPAGLMALDRGEIIVMQLSGEQRSQAMEWLYSEAAGIEEGPIGKALLAIAKALEDSTHRQIQMRLEEGEEEWEHTGRYRVKGKRDE